MSKVIMRCPECGAVTRLHLIDSTYEGPYRCWKCRALFIIRVRGSEVRSYEPLSEEELEE